MKQVDRNELEIKVLTSALYMASVDKTALEYIKKSCEIVGVEIPKSVDLLQKECSQNDLALALNKIFGIKYEASKSELGVKIFDNLWQICVRKESKEQAKKTFFKLMKCCKNDEETRKKGVVIYKLYQSYVAQWEQNGTQKIYIPLLSSWLNANIPEGVI